MDTPTSSSAQSIAEQILYNVSEGIFAVDTNYNITIFNSILEKMLGLSKESVIGKPFDKIISVESKTKEPIDLKQYFFKTQALFDVILKGPTQNYYVNIKFSGLKTETNTAECLITMSDTTKEISLDKAKDDFLALASHELFTPLTIIKSYLWMLNTNQDGILNEKQAEYANKAYHSTETLISMVSDMLNVSRLEQGRLTFNCKAGKIVATVQEALKGFDIKAKEKNINLKFDISQIHTELDAFYDEEKLRGCIVNYLANAIKFTKEGGVTIKIETDTDFVKISVTDTGVGVSDKDRSKLFSKFGKGETSYNKIVESGGNGLGLYIVKIYVEAMGGQVGYNSDGDFKGSTFWLTVPKHTVLHD